MIDCVVTKIPRFAFEKFPQADPTLTTQMKSVGEAMAIGRTFKESLQKCLRSLPERGCGKAQPQHVRKHTPQNIFNRLRPSTCCDWSCGHSRVPSESSVRSEIFVEAHATKSPNRVGATSSAPEMNWPNWQAPML